MATYICPKCGREIWSGAARCIRCDIPIAEIIESNRKMNGENKEEAPKSEPAAAREDKNATLQSILQATREDAEKKSAARESIRKTEQECATEEACKREEQEQAAEEARKRSERRRKAAGEEVKPSASKTNHDRYNQKEAENLSGIDLLIDTLLGGSNPQTRKNVKVALGLLTLAFFMKCCH